MALLFKVCMTIAPLSHPPYLLLQLLLSHTCWHLISKSHSKLDNKKSNQHARFFVFFFDDIRWWNFVGSLGSIHAKRCRFPCSTLSFVFYLAGKSEVGWGKKIMSDVCASGRARKRSLGTLKQKKISTTFCFCHWPTVFYFVLWMWVNSTFSLLLLWLLPHDTFCYQPIVFCYSCSLNVNRLSMPFSS